MLSHVPVDLVIIMLGTNDLKKQFNPSAKHISSGIEEYIKYIKNPNLITGYKIPKILVVSPVPLRDEIVERQSLFGNFDENGLIKSLPNTPWQLRAAALDRKLTPLEWSAVLLHLIKHRGYLSQRKNEGETADKELGALLKGVADNAHTLQTGDFRTPAELALNKFEKESGHIRNQRGDYSHTFSRKDLQAELNLLFEKQKEFGNPHVSDGLKEGIETLLMTQRPALSGDAVQKMLGHCTFEPAEPKAAKNTYTAERFIWLTKLNNLRILEQGSERPLTATERATLMDEPYRKSKLTYAQARKLLGLEDTAFFKGLRYGKDNAEASTLMEMKAYHAISRALEKEGLKDKKSPLNLSPELQDEIGTAFSLFKTDEDITGRLKDRVQPEILEALLKHISFDKFVQISLKALRRIVPLMEQGKRYDEACAEIYGDHYGKKNAEEKIYLPPIPADEIRNPVVLRALSQARKVINAVVRRYGSPARIHIETAREVGKSFKDRKEIEKRQEENRKDREKAAAEFQEYFPNFVGEPKSKDILKLRLYRQQNCKCLYSGKEINLGRLNEKGYVEIDHALPFSRTWDDSFNNKVLVLGSENQNKGKLIPLNVDGVEPTVKNIVDGKYYISRPLIIVKSGDLSKSEQIFVDVLNSAEGQKTIEKMGFIPVK